MLLNKINIPILIVNYNGRKHLELCLPSLLRQTYAGVVPVMYMVDNASTDGSLEYVREHFPEVRIIESKHNLGFAGGNNLGWQYIQRDLPDARYFFLLNQDTIIEEDFLTPLVEYMDQHLEVGAVQPVLRLYPDKTKINSLGNIIHFLGFGYSSSNFTEASVPQAPTRINYASGAAVLLRAEAVRQVGLFDDFMFMYLEDLDLGWKLSLAGWNSVLVPNSTVYHAYEFSRGMRQYYYFERNRLWILFKNYRLATLVMLIPALLAMELGQLLFALREGRLGTKLGTYGYFLKPSSWRVLRRDRAVMQRLRRRSDRAMVGSFTGRIDFQPLMNPLIRYVANPCFAAYRAFIRLILLW